MTTRTKEKKVAGPKNDRLELAAALSAITTKCDGWVKAIEDFNVLRRDILSNVETELQTKKRQRDELDQEYEQVKRAKKIDMEQELAEFGYSAAVRLLQQRQERPISCVELDQLREKVATLEKQSADELKQAVEAERASCVKSMTFERNTLKLQHEKETSQLTAQGESLKAQLESCRAEVAKAETRLDAQRELTKQVAEACKTPSVIQNMKQ